MVSSPVSMSQPVKLLDPSRPRSTVYEAPERRRVEAPRSLNPDEYEAYARSSTPIVIDNGALSLGR